MATHVATGVANRGSDPSEAVAMAVEAAALDRVEHQPGDEPFQQQMLQRLGIDPAEAMDEIELPNRMP